MSKILAVDNDTFILEFMKNILSAEGHEVMTAEDGLSAVDILETYVPDIIFVDLIMPNIDGRRLCKIIRGMRKLENVFLVILSATVLEDEIDTEALGVDVCIPKGPLNEMAQNVISALNRIGAAPPPYPPSAILGGENITPRSITGDLLSMKRHFEAIFERMSEGILELTRNGRIVYANSAAISLMGLPEEKVLASSFTDVLSEDYHQTVTRLIETVHEGAVRITEDPLISLNEYLLTVKALPVDSDASTAVIILDDVTKQKEAEETLRRHNRELELLNLASRALNSSLDLDHVLVTVLDELRRLIDVARSTIWLVDPVSGELVCREAIGISREVLNGWRLEPKQGLAGWIVDHGKSLNVSDTRTDTRHYKGVDSATGIEIRSVIGVPLIAKGSVIGVIEVVDTEPGRFDTSYQALLEWLAASAAIAIDNARLYEQAQQEISDRERAEKNLSSSVKNLRKTLNGTIQAIALIAESRDPYTAGHQRRVANLAQGIAREMGLSEAQIEGIRVAGLVHDIGKMAIPAEILSKPGMLSKEEFALIKKHPQAGYDILKEIEFPWPIAKIVLQHHERMDGSGYPKGLSGEEILIEARILCVSDVVEAMVSHRPYRPALGIAKTLEEFDRKEGELYDPEVVRVCLKLFKDDNFRFE